MKFESKYDVGNTPWFMKNNKPIQCRISNARRCSTMPAGQSSCR